MQQQDINDDALLANRFDDICQGLTEAIDREVEILRQQGLPIHVADNGKVIDLNANPQNQPG